MRTAIHATLTAICLAIPFTPAQAQSLAELKTLGVCELDRIFEQAPPGEIPVGYGRGHVLVMVDARKPRLNAFFSNSVWKGKHFDESGDFINQWPGFRALRGHAEPGPSWHDGKPCLAIAYPRGTPVFGNSRDEMRQVAQGLFLCRLYELCPCPRFRGYFVITTCGAAINTVPCER